MRWQGGRRSSNIEDRRGSGVGRPLALGGGVTPLVVALLVMFLGGRLRHPLPHGPARRVTRSGARSERGTQILVKDQLTALPSA
ncbi:MAG TPA: neutral zinc metallopeptidase [Archangium sp.]|uniref:neutral zinc metallopeptidase n=1 Tax=Archangium sp. TaxID=1872627 RepID=UPI002E330D71|nr:neutral zinc metallopeptidase [Archangium sp.]HEX5753296.1 neutral zinc metallopeptidase [Archangium sp.]